MSASLCTLAALLALASAPVEAPAATPLSSSYVTVNVGVELHALEAAAADTAAATRELAKAVTEMATSDALSEEHEQRLMAVLGRVDTLSSRVVSAVERLPAAIEESREPLTAMADDLATRVRVTIILVLALVLLVLVGALAAVYYTVLRPTKRMTADTLGRFQTLAGALERTAELVGESSARQVALAERLHPEPPPPRAAEAEPTPDA